MHAKGVARDVRGQQRWGQPAGATGMQLGREEAGGEGGGSWEINGGRCVFGQVRTNDTSSERGEPCGPTALYLCPDALN